MRMHISKTYMYLFGSDSGLFRQVSSGLIQVTFRSRYGEVSKLRSGEISVTFREDRKRAEKAISV